MQSINDENDSDCDSITSIDSFFESSFAKVAADNERLICENKSLMEIIKRLQDDVAIAEKTISDLNIENNNLKDQLDASKEFTVVTTKKRNSPPTTLTNRFHPLTKDFPPLPKTRDLSIINNSSPRPKHGKPQRQVLVIGDSHARGCTTILKEQLGGEFAVSGIVKPNARLNDVVRDIEKLAANFNKNDHIVVFGGTNDLGQYNPHDYTIRKGLETLSTVSSNTNVTLSAIPQRYDIPTMNSLINNTNIMIKQVTEQHQINFSHPYIHRSYYTRHGLHLNYSGKEFVCHQIKDSILKMPRNKSTFLDRWVLRPQV